MRFRKVIQKSVEIFSSVGPHPWRQEKRDTVPDMGAGEKVNGNPGTARNGKTDKLALRQVEGQLGLDTVQIV